ncbi:hypothetical protein D3C80_448620 [compost metagenome]
MNYLKMSIGPILFVVAVLLLAFCSPKANAIPAVPAMHEYDFKYAPSTTDGNVQICTAVGAAVAASTGVTLDDVRVMEEGNSERNGVKYFKNTVYLHSHTGDILQLNCHLSAEYKGDTLVGVVTLFVTDQYQSFRVWQGEDSYLYFRSITKSQ